MRVFTTIKMKKLHRHIKKRDEALLAAKEHLLNGHEVKYKVNMAIASFHIPRISKLTISIEKDLLKRRNNEYTEQMYKTFYYNN